MSKEVKKANRKWFDDELEIIDMEDVYNKQSIFGNDFFRITDEQLNALKHGKVLHASDEYGTFIILDNADWEVKE